MKEEKQKQNKKNQKNKKKKLSIWIIFIFLNWINFMRTTYFFIKYGIIKSKWPNFLYVVLQYVKVILSTTKIYNRYRNKQN